ncbi:MAG: tRNA (adenosine(37)-N6)-threonylcarbamoyltransferase complex dimerization subunit type 1 TsaB [Desulfobulbus sp.]|jgi:tRNA threonylcarbamoyladenosine biosynthesis protein TsaB|uniref:tRNA (adenosine(37)-N6)-threonylcarbamoyltransferase complex dimerization subunit type 1 TsaB n=1 Tax=Desulfobulbus sp. TaxID=895 RepID=UPI002847D923|nr:tRNA (adenosine(37)-N6)-threonylcarbamoyltransferase complex dimerization subunit type 1 TsaB [Desulfobulbus sp.]MDR2550072.1 tRNA (adenosine(37)-N6)-threonylcarbamoyltransferase complex dimerization subunit type 1 TsaB [Desulfobulbus sp.]
MADVLILAIETATGCGSVALTRGPGSTGKVLAEYTLQPEVTHARRLLGSVAAVMAAAGVGWNELSGVAVSQGPGSFTGLRIGMAAAQGLAMALGMPLLPVPTLDGLAAQVVGHDLPLCCLLDARKQQIYAGFYRYRQTGWHREAPFLVLGPKELARRIQQPTLLVGPGLQTCRDEMTAQPLARLADAALLHPRAASIGLCAGRMLADGAVAGEGGAIPLYVRASEAELNLQTMQEASRKAV